MAESCAADYVVFRWYRLLVLIIQNQVIIIKNLDPLEFRMKHVFVVFMSYVRTHTGDGGAGFFDGIDHFDGGLADAVKRGFQLRHFLVLAPAGHIGKGIV